VKHGPRHEGIRSGFIRAEPAPHAAGPSEAVGCCCQRPLAIRRQSGPADRRRQSACDRSHRRNASARSPGTCNAPYVVQGLSSAAGRTNGGRPLWLPGLLRPPLCTLHPLGSWLAPRLWSRRFRSQVRPGGVRVLQLLINFRVLVAGVSPGQSRSVPVQDRVSWAPEVPPFLGLGVSSNLVSKRGSGSTDTDWTRPRISQPSGSRGCRHPHPRTGWGVRILPAQLKAATGALVSPGRGVGHVTLAARTEGPYPAITRLHSTETPDVLTPIATPAGWDASPSGPQRRSPSEMRSDIRIIWRSSPRATEPGSTSPPSPMPQSETEFSPWVFHGES
jgi:hypothetical protein